MRFVADACTTLRIALAPVFAWAVVYTHGAPSLLPLGIYLVAAGSDFADGRLARAAGSASERGRLFDHAADAFFLFPTLIVLAALARVPLLLPCAAVLAFALYILDGWRRGRRRQRIALLPSQLGAVGGVLNYVVAGVAASALALGPTPLDRALFAGGFLAGAVNLIAAAERVSALVRPHRTLTSRLGRS